MTTREEVIKAAKEADPGFDGGVDADGTMADSIVGIEAVARFYNIAFEHGRQAERNDCVLECSNWIFADSAADSIRARRTK